MTLTSFGENLYYPFRIFTALSLNFLAGILAASFLTINFQVSWPIFLITFFCLIFTTFINFILKNKFMVLASFGALFLILGLSYYSFFEYKTHVDLPYNQNMEVTGMIIKNPEIDYKQQKLVVKWNKRDSHLPKDAFILVTAPHFPAYHYGEIIKIKGKITEPQNFTEFDYRSYLKRYLIFGTIQNAENITYMGKSKSISTRFNSSLYNISIYFESIINKILPEPHASLADGILLGVKKNIPDSLMTLLQNTGLTHIIALSGFNVTIIVVVLVELFVIYLGRRNTTYVGSALVILFVIMTGASPSVVRAAIFSLLILFGTLMGRKADNLNLMLLAALVMVGLNPYILRYDLGFQLSFLAFAGLIYLGPLISNFFDKVKSKFFPDLLKPALAETLGAQFATTPLILLTFGKVSLIAPVANILIVWIVPWVMLLTFFVGILGMISLPIGKAVAIFLWPLIQFIIKMVELFGNLPGAAVNFK